MASAPLRSLAALAICGRYATTRKLLHSVNAASVMSAIVIPRASCLVGNYWSASSVNIRADQLSQSYSAASESLHFAQKLPRLCARADGRQSAGPITLTCVALLRIVCWTDERTPAGSGASHLDDHRLLYCDEMGDVCGLCVEASRRQRFQRRLIELLAVAYVPSAGQDRHLAIVGARVRGELVSGGKLQAERIGAVLGRIPYQVRLLHARHGQAALRRPPHF